jgi:hypothetical protein
VDGRAEGSFVSMISYNGHNQILVIDNGSVDVQTMWVRARLPDQSDPERDRGRARRGQWGVAMRWCRVVLACGLSSAIASAGAAAAGFKLVANPGVPVSSLSRAEVSSVFLKKTEKWPNGAPIIPVDQGHDSPLRQAFCRDVHEKSPTMIDAYWQKQVFSGRSSPPLSRAGDGDVISFLKSTAGAIGYVSATADTAGLKEIRIE